MTVTNPGGSGGLTTVPLPSGWTDNAASSAGLLVRGGQIKIINEAYGLNALDGYLVKNSAADQHAGLQAFLNAVATSPYYNGRGSIPPPGNQPYFMGTTQVTAPSGPCNIIGAGGRQGTGIYSADVVLQWNDGVSTPFSQACLAGWDSTAGYSQSLSGLTIQVNQTYSTRYGVLPSGRAGINIHGTVRLADINVMGASAALTIGGSGAAGDHNDLNNICSPFCGFGIVALAGTTTGGDFHGQNLKMECNCAGFGHQGGCLQDIYGGGFIRGSGAYGAIGFLRFWDGTAAPGNTAWVAGLDAVSLNIESPGSAAMHDTYLLSGANAGIVQDVDFGRGAFQAQTGTYAWTGTFAITNIAGNTITVQDPYGGFFFMPTMTCSGGSGGWTGQYVTAVSNTWPGAIGNTTILTLNAAPPGGATSVVLSMPNECNAYAGSLVRCTFPGAVQSVSGKPMLYAINFVSQCQGDDALDALTIAQGAGIIGMPTQFGAAATTPFVTDNYWGVQGSGTNKVGVWVNNGGAISQYDIVEIIYNAGFGVNCVRTATGQGKALGATLTAYAANNNPVNFFTGRNTTVHNKGAGAIAASTLIKVDTANPGGVTTAASLADGPAIGLSTTAGIGATSTGPANLWC